MLGSKLVVNSLTPKKKKAFEVENRQKTHAKNWKVTKHTFQSQMEKSMESKMAT